MRKQLYLALLLGITLAACSGTPATLTPTSAPTLTPTSAPTLALTSAPTLPPTSAPTLTPTSAPTLAPTSPPTAPPNLQGMTLTLWTSPGIAQPFHDVWSNFEKATGAKIEYIAIPDPFEDSLMAKWVAGDRPDILGFHGDTFWLKKLQPETNLVDLSNEAFVAKTKFNLFNYTGAMNGKVYAAFTAYPTVDGVYYNADVFKRLGLTIPTDWAGLRQLCDQITAADNSVTPIVSGAGAQWPLFFMGSSYMSDETKAGIENDINGGSIKFTDPRVIAEFQTMLDMKDQGCFEKDLATTQYEDQTARLYEGKAAMAFSGTFILDDLNASYGADKVATTIGYFPISAHDQTANWTVSQAGTYEVPLNQDPAKQAAALAFVRYVTSDGFQAYLDASGDLPIFQGFNPPANVTATRKLVDQALQGGAVPSYGTSFKYTPGQYQVWMNDMLTGGKTPLQVGQAMQNAWDTAAAAAGASPMP